MSSLVTRKYIVAGTGLFLCIFLITHLSGNLILLWPEETARNTYNSYAAFLSNNILIKIVAYGLYLSILAHIIYAIVIIVRNKKAQGKGYAVNHANQTSTWASRHMGLLGLLVLIFLVLHLANFWARAKLGIGEEVPVDQNGNKDLYSIAQFLFQNVYYVLFYSLLMIPLGFHLFHGFKSAFKSLGMYHKRRLDAIAKISLVFALIITVGFGSIPLIMYLR